MKKIFFLILLLFSFVNASVDIVVDSFSNYKKAQKGLKELEKFIKDKNLTASAKIEQLGDFFYLKIGRFSESVRDDEKFLAMFAIKYPNMIIVTDKVTPKLVNKDKIRNNFTTTKESFLGKNESLIQWILFLVMFIWGGVILYFRFKTIKKVKEEQNEISKEQTDIELKLTKKGKDDEN
jgi:hypothetical protein